MVGTQTLAADSGRLLAPMPLSDQQERWLALQFAASEDETPTSLEVHLGVHDLLLVVAAAGVVVVVAAAAAADAAAGLACIAVVQAESSENMRDWPTVDSQQRDNCADQGTTDSQMQHSHYELQLPN